MIVHNIFTILHLKKIDDDLKPKTQEYTKLTSIIPLPLINARIFYS